MNERIAHLYQVAIQDTMDHHDENPKVKQKELDNFCATRFSELIVRECISQAHGVAELRGANEDMIYGADTAAGRIAKHFGVEK